MAEIADSFSSRRIDRLQGRLRVVGQLRGVIGTALVDKDQLALITGFGAHLNAVLFQPGLPDAALLGGRSRGLLQLEIEFQRGEAAALNTAVTGRSGGRAVATMPFEALVVGLPG